MIFCSRGLVDTWPKGHGPTGPHDIVNCNHSMYDYSKNNNLNGFLALDRLELEEGLSGTKNPWSEGHLILRILTNYISFFY